MAASAASALANAAGAPLAMKVSLPLSAPTVPPLTGASRNSRPAAATFSASARASAAGTVLESTTTPSGAMALHRTVRPQQHRLGLRRIDDHDDHHLGTLAAAAAGDAAGCPPAAASASPGLGPHVEAAHGEARRAAASGPCPGPWPPGRSPRSGSPSPPLIPPPSRSRPARRRAAAGAPARRGPATAARPAPAPTAPPPARPASRSPAGHSRSSVAVQPLREAPSMTGQPRPWNRARWRMTSRLCGSCLAKHKPGSTITRERAMPAASQASDARGQPVVAPRARTARSAAPGSWSRARRPCASARRRRPTPAATSRLRGSWVRPLTSLMIAAPAATAAAITAALRVSIETVTPCRASASTTGSTRRSSSPDRHLDRTRPGRLAAHVDDVRTLLPPAAGHARPRAPCRHAPRRR